MTHPDSAITSDGPSAGTAGDAVPASAGWLRPGPAAGQAATVARDRSASWLRGAAAGLGALAAASAAVSFTAQYQMVYSARRLAVVAGLEAAIPDAAALIFACLGIALALHGRRALRARALNLAAVSASTFMNAIAAAPGWRGLAIWVMPAVAYALASDTLISVLRATVIARHQAVRAIAGDEAAPLAVLGGLALWLLRLSLAPCSTLRGFRAWVIAECPVAPRHRAARPPLATATTALTPVTRPVPPAAPRRHGPRPGTKTARFLALTAEAHGPLASIPLDKVSKISADLAPKAGLDAGAARTALRRAVLTAQEESTR